ncbi:MAG: cytochrome c oxidase assembly protein [Actinomycetota bacterium]
MPKPDLPEILTAWSFQPLVLASILAAGGLYLGSIRRIGRGRGNRWPGLRSACFLGGLGALAIALLSPVGAYADVFLWVHMVQHILITLLAAPLLVLGAPVTLALRVTRPEVRRGLLRILRSLPSRVISHPILAWLLFAAALVGSHFSPLYQAALEDPTVHVLEHVLYLSTALLFWVPVVGLDPGRWKLAHPVRLLYLFLAAPVNTAVALAIYSASGVLYPAYEAARTWGPSPLADQRLAGALMWIVGDLILLAAVILAAAAWLRHDRVLASRLDARSNKDQAPAAGAGSG